MVVESHSVPLVTIEITVHNGSMTEPVDYNGLSHLYEHMFFKANKALPSQEAFLRRTQELGLVWYGATSQERVNYSFTGTKDHTEELMQLMHDALVSPLFDPKELDRERVVVTGEIDRNEASPLYHLNKAINDRVFWKYPSRRYPLGNRATVLKATVAQLQTIQRRYYVPNNSALVVTGDVTAAEIFAEADRLYADWPKGEDPFIKFPLVKHPPIKKTEVAVVEQPVHMVTGQMTWQGPSVAGDEIPMTYAADALSSTLSEPWSRWTKALVESGACVSVSISWATQVNTGPIKVSFQATPDKVDTCITAIRAELVKMESPDYLTQEELHRGAHTYEIGAVHERERPSQLSHSLTFAFCYGGLDYYLLSYPDNLYKVTPADVARYVTTYIKDRPFVFGIMVSSEMRKAGLDQKHFDGLIKGRVK
ncbi:MAG TPA: pitrilysin family protein [Kofleriaceae bacterium]